MVRNTCMLLVVMFLLGIWGTSAFTATNDISLWRFCQRDPNTGLCVNQNWNTSQVEPDNARFAKFTKQLAAVISPKYHAPAETLGWLGWNLGFEFTINDIQGGEHWDDALEGVERFQSLDTQNQKSRGAPDLLNTVQFHARKGLPFSTEVGIVATYIINSKMVALGVEGKFAFVEGFTYVPDMAVRVNYTHLFNAADLDMNMWGWDLSISKNFPIGGFFQIAPYAGYSMVYSIASPNVVNPTFDPANAGRLLKLDRQNQLLHRGFFGLRMIATHVAFTPEIIVTNAKVYSYSFNIGADF